MLCKSQKTVKCHFHVRVHVHSFGSIDMLLLSHINSNTFVFVIRTWNLFQCFGFLGWCVMGHVSGSYMPAVSKGSGSYASPKVFSCVFKMVSTKLCLRKLLTIFGSPSKGWVMYCNKYNNVCYHQRLYITTLYLLWCLVRQSKNTSVAVIGVKILCSHRPSKHRGYLPSKDPETFKFWQRIYCVQLCRWKFFI